MPRFTRSNSSSQRDLPPSPPSQTTEPPSSSQNNLNQQHSQQPLATKSTDQSRFLTRKFITDALRIAIPDPMDPSHSSGSKGISAAPRASSSAQRGSIITPDQKRVVSTSRNPPTSTTKQNETVVRANSNSWH